MFPAGSMSGRGKSGLPEHLLHLTLLHILAQSGFSKASNQATWILSAIAKEYILRLARSSKGCGYGRVQVLDVISALDGQAANVLDWAHYEREHRVRLDNESVNTLANSLGDNLTSEEEKIRLDFTLLEDEPDQMQVDVKMEENPESDVKRESRSSTPEDNMDIDSSESAHTIKGTSYDWLPPLPKIETIALDLDEVFIGPRLEKGAGLQVKKEVEENLSANELLDKALNSTAQPTLTRPSILSHTLDAISLSRYATSDSLYASIPLQSSWLSAAQPAPLWKGQIKRPSPVLAISHPSTAALHPASEYLLPIMPSLARALAVKGNLQPPEILGYTGQAIRVGQGVGQGEWVYTWISSQKDSSQPLSEKEFATPDCVTPTVLHIPKIILPSLRKVEELANNNSIARDEAMTLPPKDTSETFIGQNAVENGAASICHQAEGRHDGMPPSEVAGDGSVVGTSAIRSITTDSSSAHKAVNTSPLTDVIASHSHFDPFSFERPQVTMAPYGVSPYAVPSPTMTTELESNSISLVDVSKSAAHMLEDFVPPQNESVKLQSLSADLEKSDGVNG